MCTTRVGDSSAGWPSATPLGDKRIIVEDNLIVVTKLLPAVACGNGGVRDTTEII